MKLTMHKVARRKGNAIPGRRERSAAACVQETCEAVNAQSCQEKGQRNAWQARAECSSMRAGNMSSADNAQSCQDKGQRNSWQARAECRSMRAGNM